MPASRAASDFPPGPSSVAVRRPRAPLRFSLRAVGVEQAALLCACGLRIAARSLAGLPGDWLANAGDRRARREARAVEASRTLVRTLGALKGAFAKAGQFASLRVDVLSPEVRETFVALQDRVPPLPVAQIRRVVEAELGGPLETWFADFEPAPLGAASVAQVHRARLHSGELVAVKVQYPWLRDSLPADLRLARLMLRLLGGPGGPDRARLFGEFSVGLAEELDFRREARVASEIAANLADERQVVVPRVVPELCSTRVLTMSYVDALPISDPGRLRAAGIPLDAVVETLGRAYARQVFADGLFHADPHPGNLFVVDEPDAVIEPRILFVDFGLSRRLEPGLRDEMRTGIHALLRQDPVAFVDAMERMDMVRAGSRAGVEAAVRDMFDRIRAEGHALGLGGSQVLALKDHAKALLASTEGLQLPNDLLLYAKTLSYLFALGENLAPDVDLMRVSVPHLLRFLAGKDSAR